MLLLRRSAPLLWLTLLACSAEFHAGDGLDADGSGGNGLASLAPGVLPTVSGGANGTGANLGLSTGSALGSGGAPSSSGGSAPGGGAKASLCALGKVTLRAVPPPAAKAGSYCGSDCSVGWLEITSSEGASVVVDLPCGAVTCDRCEQAVCKATACKNSPLTTLGLEYVWDGTRFLANACGAASLCQERSCVPPGRYVAKMCVALAETAAGAAACVASEKVLCTPPVAFDFPGTALVTGILPAP